MKTILVGSVTGFFLWYHWPQMMRLMAESPITAMGNAMDLVGLCALLVVLGVIPMVGFDVFPNLQPPEKAANVTAGYS